MYHENCYGQRTIFQQRSTLVLLETNNPVSIRRNKKMSNEATETTVSAPEQSATPKSAAVIAETVVGSIEWKTATEGFCQCPGMAKHTTRGADKDCRVHIDKVPTVFCFHHSCRREVKLANERLRSDFMDAETAKFRLGKRVRPQALSKQGLIATADTFVKTPPKQLLSPQGDRKAQVPVVLPTPTVRGSR